MSISSISSTTAPPDIRNWQAITRQRKQDFQSLANSLKSGDLGGAQQAFSDVQKLVSASLAKAPSGSGTSPVQLDATALGKDLTAGDLTQAQKDFTQLKTDVQSVLSQSGISSGMRQHGPYLHKPDPTPQIVTSAISSLLSQYAPANSANSSTAASLLSLIG